MTERSPIEWALLPLKRYAQFSGRSPRAEYWWFYLGYLIISFLINILTLVSSLFQILGLVSLALIVPHVAVAVRRLHDTDRTGWWLLSPVLPVFLGVLIMFSSLSGGGAPGFAVGGLGGLFLLIGFVLAIALFVFTVLPGTAGPNSYGPDPYGADDNLEEVFA
ncbi:MAG: DUF805 domain-containing protein [Sphingomicrobium sp.]